jgi:hypothetical protein
MVQLPQSISRPWARHRPGTRTQHVHVNRPRIPRISSIVWAEKLPQTHEQGARNGDGRCSNI